VPPDTAQNAPLSSVESATPPVGHVPSSAAPSFRPIAPLPVVPASPYATWALVVGILGLICFGAGPILGLIAMVLGTLGWRQVTKASGALRGRFSAGAGIAAGLLSIAFFTGEVALYLSLMRPAKVAAPAPSTKDSSDPAAAVAPNDSKGDPSTGAQAVTPAEPPSNTSTVTTVGTITVVDVALGVASLANELRAQHAEATAHGERLLLETTSADSSCGPCQGFAASLSDPRMQSALDKIRLVRVDREPFEDDLTELEIPVKPFPGFFLLDSNLRVTDGINGGEWKDDVAANIAPVLGPFVRGAYNGKRLSPWKKLPRPGGTVL
jgi:hypothetical protein